MTGVEGMRLVASDEAAELLSAELDALPPGHPIAVRAARLRPYHLAHHPACGELFEVPGFESHLLADNREPPLQWLRRPGVQAVGRLRDRAVALRDALVRRMAGERWLRRGGLGQLVGLVRGRGEGAVGMTRPRRTTGRARGGRSARCGPAGDGRIGRVRAMRRGLLCPRERSYQPRPERSRSPCRCRMIGCGPATNRHKNCHNSEDQRELRKAITRVASAYARRVNGIVE